MFSIVAALLVKFQIIPLNIIGFSILISASASASYFYYFFVVVVYSSSTS